MSVTPFVIAIGHKARSGKDAFAWFLLDALRREGIDARRYGFADALKAVCRVEYGLVGKDAGLLQRVGVEYRDGWRGGHAHGYVAKPTPTVWIDACFAAIDEDAPQVAILADCRFNNEAEAVKARGGLTVKVDRPDRPIDRDPNHLSEVDLDLWPWDEVIDNSATLDDLEVEAWALARRVRKLL